MAIRLIFLNQWRVTVGVTCSSLLDWKGEEAHPGNNSHIKSVPETDTGGKVEYTKALERTVLKELGKLHA